MIPSIPSLLGSLLNNKSRADKCRAPSRRAAPVIEPLESRIAPATFTVVGSTLSISLQNVNESVTFHTDGTTITATLANGTVSGGGAGVTGVGTASAQITSASFSSITIHDGVVAGEAVSFANSGTATYSQAFTAALANAASGNITFTGASAFSSSLSLTTAGGNVISDAASSVSLTSGANLAVTATGHDVLFNGALNIGGTTAIAAGVVEMHNAANVFTGALQLIGPDSGNVFASGPLGIAASTFAFGALNQAFQITAAGNITQTGAISATGTGALGFSSTGGDITLTNTSNSTPATVAVGLSVTGTHNASLYDAAVLQLGNTSLGTGTLNVTATGNVTQKSGTGIVTQGPANFTVDLNTNRDIIANSATNNIGGAVTVAESNGGSIRDFSLRNINEHATAPTGAPFTTPGDIRNLTLYYDNSGIALAGYNITAELNVTAGGAITQNAALTIGGTSIFSVLGDFGINVSNGSNALTGAVSFNAAHSTQPITIDNSQALILGASSLGRGAFSATATGNITENGAMVQEKGAEVADFTVTGTSISLTNNINDFTGALDFIGTGLTTLNVHNSDYQAVFGQLSIPATVTGLTVVFNHAPVVLPSLTLTNLTVTAQGITEQASAALNISGQTTLNANAAPINLESANNNFANVTLSNSGPNPVTVDAAGGINFSGTSTLGTGNVLIHTVGGINETGAITQSNTGTVGGLGFISDSASMSLTGANTFIGPVSLSVSGVNAAGIANGGGAVLTLGNVTTGIGGLTAASGSLGIAQSPGTVLNLGGPSAFNTSGGGPVTLPNSGNVFSGAVTITAGDTTLASKGAITLGMATITGDLTLTSDGVSQTGALGVTGEAIIHAGAGSVALADSSNGISEIAVYSTGTSVSVFNATQLNVDTMQLGGGTLSLSSNNNIEGSGGAITQTGAGAITLSAGAGDSIDLTNPSNHLLGQLNITNSGEVTIVSAGNVGFASGSTITGALNITSGGVVTLPSNLTGLTELQVSAVSTNISSNVTASQDSISIAGAVNLSSGLTLSANGEIAFSGNVNVAGPLTLDVASGGSVMLTGGVWNQGANNLTINGTGASLQIGNSSASGVAFDISSATIAMPGGGSVIVSTGAAFNIGASPSGDVVTITGGSNNLAINGTLGIGFGAVNGQLDLATSGSISLGAQAQLIGTGLAGFSATPVLIAESGALVGSFAGSMTSLGASHDFFAGSDIVTPNYTATELSIQAGGVTSSTGTASGFLPNGESYTVTSTLGANAGLTTLVDLAGNLDIVLRGTSTAASKLMINTSSAANTFVPVGNVFAHPTGSLSVTAPKANFSGSITTAGVISSLAAHDLDGASNLLPFVLTSGGAAASKTTITAHDVLNTTINLPGTLSSLTAVSVANSVNITAVEFGKIITTGDAAGSTSPANGVPDSGNFEANLTSTGTGATALTSAKIAGALEGDWDLTGGVGTVTSFNTIGWTLNAAGKAPANVASLALGATASVAVDVTGAISSLTTLDIDSSTFTAGSFGTLKVLSNAKRGFVGNVSDSTFLATGNVKQNALASLNIVGNATDSSFTFDNGNVGTITIGQVFASSSINDGVAGALGKIKSITAADWSSSSVTADSLSTLKITGDLAAAIFGDFTNGTVTLQSNAAGVGLGTFSATGNVTGSTFDLVSGNLTTFKVGEQIGSTTINLADAAHSNLTLIQAGDWTTGVTVTAGTIGTLNAMGVPASNPSSGLLIGNLNGDTIDAYLSTGKMPGIGKITVKGSVLSTNINARQGITTMTVGRDVTDSVIVADNSLAGSAVVGNVGKLTVGDWLSSTLSANTLGAFSATGYLLPESGSSNFQPGNVVSGSFYIHDATPSDGLGIGTFNVNGIFETSAINTPSGANSITIAGSDESSSILAVTPLLSGFATIGTLTAGDLESSAVVAGYIGAIKTTGNSSLGLLGNVSSSTIAVTTGFPLKNGGPLTGLGSMTVAGDFSDSLLDAADAVSSIQVAGRITSLTHESGIDAGYALGGIGTLTAGAIGESGITFSTDIITQTIATITVKGNAHRGFAGTVDDAFVDLLGTGTKGNALGTFSATGAATASLFRASAGNVGSFTIGKMISSNLLVGFTPSNNSDIGAGTTSANWAAQNLKIGSFSTTAPFSSADASDSASFVDSNVIAAELGSITLSGVNPVDASGTSFGIGFRTSTGSTAGGTLKVAGTILTAPETNGQFDYVGLLG
jgi:fibronectin-binding autotransporter adhesin